MLISHVPLNEIELPLEVGNMHAWMKVNNFLVRIIHAYYCYRTETRKNMKS